MTVVVAMAMPSAVEETVSEMPTLRQESKHEFEQR
jgi:hypothetical protein